jgi:plastocyanin
MAAKGWGGLALAFALLAGPAFAEGAAVQVTLKDHKFTPAEVEAPAGKPLTIEIVNQDSTAAEFESKDLRVEKVAPAGGKATVRVRALKPGRYRFFDDYHESTAVGYLVVK